MRALILNCSPVRNGATAEIVRMISESLQSRYETKTVCIDDYAFHFCRGCRSCHLTARCVQHDGVDALMAEFDESDILIAVSPSYWADVPGQFKAFIDRCTPWCDTHEPHASLRPGKRGYAIALRTGPGKPECERILQTIRHFFGHLKIESSGGLCLCSVENRRDALARKDEIAAFCETI